MNPTLGMVPDRPRPVIPPPPPPPRPRADDVVWGRTDREHRSQVDVSRALSVVGGRWGFDTR